MFVWGGIVAGLYTLSLTIIGQRFQGGGLVTANAALVMLYGGGAVIGPFAGGVAMGLWNPHGLIVIFSASAGLFVAIALIKRSWKTDYT